MNFLGGTQLENVQRVVWAMICADDIGIVSSSLRVDGLARMMAMVMVACQESYLVVSESKTESILWSEQSSAATATAYTERAALLSPKCCFSVRVRQTS